MRKFTLILCLVELFQLTSVGGSREASYSPEVYTDERYQNIWSRKPFSPPTATASVSQAEGIEQQYVLSGLLKVGEKWIAFVQDRKSLKRHPVSTTPTEVGLQLVSVKEAGSASTVIIRSGQQTGVIRFDPTVSKAADDLLKGVPQDQSVTKPHLSSSSDVSSTPQAKNESHTPVQTLHPSMVDLIK